MLRREESEKSGIYFLTGTDPETGKPAIYIGEAECIRDRIKNHNDRDFWNQVTFFVSKDENLTKAHIRHLEGKLLELAKAAGRAVLTNTQSSTSKLPESDRGEMEVFLEKVNQLLPVLGIDLLVPMAGDHARLGHAFPGQIEITPVRAPVDRVGDRRARRLGGRTLETAVSGCGGEVAQHQVRVVIPSRCASGTRDDACREPCSSAKEGSVLVGDERLDDMAGCLFLQKHRPSLARAGREVESGPETPGGTSRGRDRGMVDHKLGS